MPRLKLTEWTKKLFKGRKQDKNEDSASERVQDRISACLLFLESLRNSSDVCPPLKSVVGGLYRIIYIVQWEMGNKETGKRLAERAESMLSWLAGAILDATNPPHGLVHVLEVLGRTVDDICGRLLRMRGKAYWKRVILQTKQSATLNDLNTKLDDAWKVFIGRSNIRLELALVARRDIQAVQRDSMGTHREMRQASKTMVASNTRHSPSCLHAKASAIANSRYTISEYVSMTADMIGDALVRYPVLRTVLSSFSTFTPASLTSFLFRTL